jgi:pimeloyl-ACP methyl ester carboxylesterase
MSVQVKRTPIHRRAPLWKRLLRWIVGILVVVIVGLYILLPIAFGVVVVFPSKQAVGQPPDGFEAITLNTDDGVRLSAWYAPPANGTAIILIHGAGGSREAIRDHAAMLWQQGYGVLALDLRGHGESGGRTNRYGWQGTHDVGAAVAYLQARDDVERIGGLGLSLGGEVLLGAAADYPEIQAIVAEGATRRTLEEHLALPSERPLVRNFVSRVMYATVQALSGGEPPRPLLNSMMEANATRFLLIAAGHEDQEVAYNELFAETVGNRTTLWVAADAEHTGAFDRYPAEYVEHVVGFLNAALLNDVSNSGREDE